MLGRDAGKDAPIVTWWLKLPFEEWAETQNR